MKVFETPDSDISPSHAGAEGTPGKIKVGKLGVQQKVRERSPTGE